MATESRRHQDEHKERIKNLIIIFIKLINKHNTRIEFNSKKNFQFMKTKFKKPGFHPTQALEIGGGVR